MDNGLVLDTAVFKLVNNLSLNPCCSGQWSSTQWKTGCKALPKTCLNPCCSGQWSSTRPYKTLLIINKLKNFTKEIFTFIN